MEQIEVESELLLFQEPGSTSSSTYIVIAGAPADAIRVAAMTGQWLNGQRGFGSAKVTVTLGETVWQTSVFPEKSSGGWFLPIKALARKAEGVEVGNIIRVLIEL